MKKGILWIAAALLLLTAACRPTPNQDFVVNKADGGMEAKLSGPAVTGPQTFPSRWDENGYAANDWLTLTFDAEILQKADGLYPVYRTKQHMYSQNEVVDWLNRLAPDPVETYQYVATKADVQQRFQEYLDQLAEQDAWVAAGKPDWGDRDEYVPTEEERQQMYTYYQGQIEQAPESIETTPVSGYGGIKLPLSHQVYTLKDGSSVNATAFADERTNFIILHKNVKTDGYLYYEYYLEEDRDDPEMKTPAAWKPVTLERSDAEAMLQKELKRLEIEDFSIMRAVPANLYDMDKEIRSVAQGWAFRLTRNYADYPTVEVPYEPSQSLKYGGGDEFIATPYIREEFIEILIGSDGLAYIEFTGPKDVTGRVNENVELLPFDELQTRVKNAFTACLTGSWWEREGKKADLKIYRMLLTTYTVKERNSGEYLEVPCWIIFYDTDEWEANRRGDMDLMHDALVINAIDGSIVHTDWGC